MKITDAVEGFLLDWQMRRRSPNTMRLYTTLLKHLVNWLEESQSITEVEQVMIIHLRAFMQAMEARVSGSLNPRRPQARDGHTLGSSALRSYVKVIKVFFGWLVEEEVITRNPSLRLAKPQEDDKIRVTLSDEHLKALFETCDLHDPHGFRDYTIMLFLLDTGLRVSEVASLKLEDIHEGYVKLMGKGRKEREVGISETVAKFLWKYVHMHRQAESDQVLALFTNYAGRPLTKDGIQKLIDRHVADAGITDIVITPHKFRHTFARTWLERGGDVYSLSRLMGHSSVKITEIYLKDFTSRQARMRHSQFSPVNGLKFVRNSKKKKGISSANYEEHDEIAE